MISENINFKNFNTGSIYRCIVLEIMDKGLDINNIEKVKKEIKNIKIDFDNEKVMLNGKDVTSKIRTEEISILSTRWGTIPEIKKVVREI